MRYPNSSASTANAHSHSPAAGHPYARSSHVRRLDAVVPALRESRGLESRSAGHPHATGSTNNVNSTEYFDFLLGDLPLTAGYDLAPLKEDFVSEFADYGDYMSGMPTHTIAGHEDASANQGWPLVQPQRQEEIASDQQTTSYGFCSQANAEQDSLTPSGTQSNQDQHLSTVPPPQIGNSDAGPEHHRMAAPAGHPQHERECQGVAVSRTQDSNAESSDADPTPGGKWLHYTPSHFGRERTRAHQCERRSHGDQDQAGRLVPISSGLPVSERNTCGDKRSSAEPQHRPAAKTTACFAEASLPGDGTAMSDSSATSSATSLSNSTTPLTKMDLALLESNIARRMNVMQKQLEEAIVVMQMGIYQAMERL